MSKFLKCQRSSTYPESATVSHQVKATQPSSAFFHHSRVDVPPIVECGRFSFMSVATVSTRNVVGSSILFFVFPLGSAG